MSRVTLPSHISASTHSPLVGHSEPTNVVLMLSGEHISHYWVVRKPDASIPIIEFLTRRCCAPHSTALAHEFRICRASAIREP